MGAIGLEREGPLAIATLAAPPVNLFDEAVFAALAALLDELERDPPRGLLLRAQGRVVSGGVDVALFDALEGDSARAASLFGEMLELVHRTERLPYPTIFAAHALCLTAAFELALACDVLLAAESARFGLVERVVGLTPAMGGTQRLALRAGPARAAELVMSGELFDASVLEGWNVVNRVYPDADFEVAARAFARALAEGPTRAHAVTKRLIGLAGTGGTPAADRVVAEAAGELFETHDLRGAVRCFLERGPGSASFEGR